MKVPGVIAQNRQHEHNKHIEYKVCVPVYVCVLDAQAHYTTTPHTHADRAQNAMSIYAACTYKLAACGWLRGDVAIFENHPHQRIIFINIYT